MSETIGIIPPPLWKKIVEKQIRGLVLEKAKELTFEELLEFIKNYDEKNIQ